MYEKRTLPPKRRQQTYQLTPEERRQILRLASSAKERARLIQVSTETYRCLTCPEGVVSGAVVERVRAKLKAMQEPERVLD